MTGQIGKFIIFAHARSGSTSLTRSLNRHPKLHVAEEPFHRSYGRWHPDEGCYADSIADAQSLEGALERIFRRYDGMKVCEDQFGWEIYTHMLTLPSSRVVLLRRRNLLRATVSELLARQTGVWQVSDLGPEARRKYASLDALPAEAVAKGLEFMKEFRDYFGEVVSRRPANERLMLYYEDFCTDDVARNRLCLARVLSFLGVDFPEAIDVDEFLDPSTARINSESVYRRIPNGRAIDERFGNDETGRLFADGD